MPQLKNPGPIELTAVIERETSVPNSSAWISFPLDLKKTYGKGNLVPIIATFDETVKYQGSLAKMGGEFACIILRKDIREQIGKQPGDSVKVRVELDISARMVKLPKDVETALTQAGVMEVFRKSSYSAQKEHHLWIEDAKRPETRTRRIAKLRDNLLARK